MSKFQEYVAALVELAEQPEKSAERLKQAQNAGEMRLTQAANARQREEETWTKVDRGLRDLTQRTAGLRIQVGAETISPSSPVQISDSQAALRRVEQLTRDLETLTKSWGAIEEQNHEAAQRRLAPPPTPRPYPNTAPAAPVQPAGKSGSKLGLIIGAVLGGAAIVGAVVMFL